MLAIVLAAGRGRRLGGPKALLELGGLTALDRCLRSLAYGGADELRVVLGLNAEAVRERVDLAGVDVVVNAHAERGQTSSLRAALERGTGAGDGFLLHTVDHPLVEARDVARLLAAWRARSAGTAIVLPSVDDHRGHPAVLAAPLAGELLALSDDEPAHRVVRRDPDRLVHVALSNPWLVRDLDTPADLEAARAALAGSAPEA